MNDEEVKQLLEAFANAPDPDYYKALLAAALDAKEGNVPDAIALANQALKVNKCGGEGGEPGPCPEGGTDTPKPKLSKQGFKNVTSKMIEGSKLSPEVKAHFTAELHSVVDKFSDNAIQRITTNLKKMRFYTTKKELTAALAPFSKQVEALASKGMVVGGAYKRDDKSLHLDGKYRDGDGGDHPPSAGYSHELAHAIDGPDHEISNSPEWQAAWKEEIQPGGISKYATTKPSEGLAEFARALHASDEAKTKFPKAYGVWRKWNL